MSHWQTITSEENLLLAYAAGELDGQALLDLEARLASDADLRQRAANLRRDYQQTLQAVAAVDEDYHVGSHRSLSQINQLIAEWQGEQERMPAPMVLHSWRPPTWSYAAAAVVALLIGFCFWWANNTATDVAQLPGVESAEYPQTAPTSSEAARAVQDDASTSANSDTATADADDAPVPLAFQDVSSEDSQQLTNLEKEVVALSNEQAAASNGESNQ